MLKQGSLPATATKKKLCGGHVQFYHRQKRLLTLNSPFACACAQAAKADTDGDGRIVLGEWQRYLERFGRDALDRGVTGGVLRVLAYAPAYSW